MPERTIAIKTPALAKKEVITCSFTDDEWQDLQDFVEAVNAIVRTRLMQSPERGSLRIKGNAGEPIQVETKLPSEGDLAEFLHRLRPIVLEKDRTSYVRVASILGHRMEAKPIRALLKSQRKRFDGKTQNVQLRQGDVQVNSERVLKDWLNAFEYHPDREKKEALEKLHRLFPLDASKVLFLSQLIEKVMAAHVLGTMIENMRQADGTVFEFPDFTGEV